MAGEVSVAAIPILPELEGGERGDDSAYKEVQHTKCGPGLTEYERPGEQPQTG